MDAEVPAGQARRFACIALAVLLVDRVVTACLFALRPRVSCFRAIPVGAATGIVFDWTIPFLIAYAVEKRGAKFLGLSVEREKYARYAAYAIVGLVLPAIVVGVDRSLFVELAEQVVYIGVAEEVFCRGYLMRRLCDWLGDRKGLVLGALIFGLSHVVSLVSQHGLKYPVSDLLMFAQTFIGGLILGTIYLRAKNIIPGSILHVAGNMYVSRIADVLSG
jgi:membrane protease YdiL (CAAX protease family)